MLANDSIPEGNSDGLPNVAFTGSAILESWPASATSPYCHVRGPCPKGRIAAWDLHTGKTFTIASPPGPVYASAWTGSALLSIAQTPRPTAPNQFDTRLVRLSPEYRNAPSQQATYRWHSVNGKSPGEIITIDGLADQRHDRYSFHLRSSEGTAVGADYVSPDRDTWLVSVGGQPWCKAELPGRYLEELNSIRTTNFDPSYWLRVLQDGATSTVINLDRFEEVSGPLQIAVTRKADSLNVHFQAGPGAQLTFSDIRTAPTVEVPTTRQPCPRNEHAGSASSD